MSTTAGTDRRHLGQRLARPLSLCLCLIALGCSSSSLDGEDQTGAAGGAGSGSEDEPGLLELRVSPDESTFVELATPSVVEVDGDGSKSIAWDLAFRGRDVFTNGGVSGPGSGAAFGPLSAPTFLSDTAPETPILLKDRAGGALLDWYDYGSETHQLFSRYHVYGLRDGDRLFKLQVLGYYGEQLGAPVPALYHIRYAEVLASGAGETRELSGIDATAGGDGSDDDEPSACVDLETQRIDMLTPEQARKSDAWQLCFRRESIAVNGGVSGPRGLTAVDLQADATAGETEQEIQERTAESELPAFDDTDHAALSDEALAWAPDGIATAFGRRWLEPGSEPAEPSDAVWLVLSADGAAKYLLKFEALSGDLGSDSASLSLRAKAVR